MGDHLTKFACHIFAWRSLIWASTAVVGLALVSVQVARHSVLPVDTVARYGRVDTVAAQHGSSALNSTTCSSCHHFDPILTHPVNITPSMMVPADLPLQNGMMTCITCHDATQSHTAEQAAVGVRGGDEAGLCFQCHANSPPQSKAIHALRVGKAHFVPELPFGNRNTTGALDAESKNCMACHDGTSASEAGSHSVRRADSDVPEDHPIGVAMRSTKPRSESDFKLANAKTLDRRVRLFSGAVGCGSCHSAYSPEPAQLVMSNRGSRLCLTCHTQ